MDKARFLIETHLRTGRPLAELAAAHGVHRSWLYKLLARYHTEGDAGLEPRSKRPHHSPTAIRAAYEDDIVALHKELRDLGVDAGPPPSTPTSHAAAPTSPPSPPSGGPSKPAASSPLNHKNDRRAPTNVSPPSSPTNAGKPT